ncbi:MAG TPA: hypothetical protein VGL61_30275 [Kofleriaceae bacterium]|jgi:hypothetical protein
MVERSLVLRVLTRCSDVDQFVSTFRRFSTDNALFVPTSNQRGVGAETDFSIRLVDGVEVLAGNGEIVASHDTARNPFGKPGILIDIRRLSDDSRGVFDRMRAPAPSAAVPDVVPIAGTNKIAAPRAVLADMLRPTTEMAPLFAEAILPIVERTPGSPIVVPANPLVGETGGSLDAFVDHAMCECVGEDITAPVEIRDSRAPMATVLGVAPLAPATLVVAPFVNDTPIPWPRASQVSMSEAAIMASTAPPILDRPERTAIVALDRSSGVPKLGAWEALCARLARSIRGVRWWLRKRRTTAQVRARN